MDVYLVPITCPEHGPDLRDTLEAYLATQMKAASAASRLGINRRTVSYRIHKIEQLLELSIPERLAELDLALRLSKSSPNDGLPIRSDVGAVVPLAPSRDTTVA